MNNYEETGTLAELHKIENKADEYTAKVVEIIDKSKSAAELATKITSSIENIYITNAELSKKVEALKITSDNNLEKFKRIADGAEKRLDKQMDLLDKLTTKLLSFDIASMKEEDVRAQQMLMNLIQDANDRFNNEIEKLYLI